MTKSAILLLAVISFLSLVVDTEAKERPIASDGAIVQGSKFIALGRLLTAEHSEAISLLNELSLYIRIEKSNDRSIEVAPILTTLEVLIARGDEDVTHAALHALTELGQSIQPLCDGLMEIAASESVPQMNRLAALECIYKSGHEPSLLSISNRLTSDPNLEIRFWALTILVFRDKKDMQVAMPVFLRALDDPILQDSAIDVFGYLGERAKAAGPSLVALQKELKDSDVASSRKKARLLEVTRIVDGLAPAWKLESGW